MGARNAKRLMTGLSYMLGAVIALSGCGGTGSGDTVPFSAMKSPDGTGTAARFNSPANVAVIGPNLYVADFDNNSIRKVVIATGEVTTLAGSNGISGSADGAGAAARFNKPFGITTDGISLYVADTGNSTIRKVSVATGAVTTLAGTAGQKGSVDKTGQAARFNSPAGITTDDGTNLYVVDFGNNSIRKVAVASRTVTTLGAGAGNNSFLFSAMTSAGATGAAAKFKKPYGIATDGANLYVANTGNSSILKLSLTSGQITPLGSGNRSFGSSQLFSAMTSANPSWSAPGIKTPYGITTDGTNLYVASTGNNTIRKLALGTDIVSSVAGTPGTTGSADGTGPAAGFNFPAGIAIDSGANLYVADNKNNTIRKVVIATEAVTTLAGKAP